MHSQAVYNTGQKSTFSSKICFCGFTFQNPYSFAKPMPAYERVTTEEHVENVPVFTIETSSTRSNDKLIIRPAAGVWSPNNFPEQLESYMSKEEYCEIIKPLNNFVHSDRKQILCTFMCTCCILTLIVTLFVFGSAAASIYGVFAAYPVHHKAAVHFPSQGEKVNVIEKEDLGFSFSITSFDDVSISKLPPLASRLSSYTSRLSSFTSFYNYFEDEANKLPRTVFTVIISLASTAGYLVFLLVIAVIALFITMVRGRMLSRQVCFADYYY